MSNNDWTDLGKDIRDMVDSAVNSRDFRQLNENVCRTVVDGLENITNNIRKGLNNMDPSAPGRNGQFGGPYNTAPGQGAYRQNNPQNVSNMPNAGRQASRPSDGNASGWQGSGGMPQGYRNVGWQSGQNRGFSLRQHPFFGKTFGAQAGGTALMAIGYVVAGICAITLLILLAVGLATGWGAAMVTAIGILTVILIGAAVMAGKGTSIVGRVKRFQKYVEALKGRTYCGVKELAEHVGKNERYVKNDLRKMIRSGLFKQGHLDRQETCLIVSNETYMQYQESQKQLELRQKQEQEKRILYQKESEGLSDEVKEMIETGREYIEKIEKSNDAIPGEEISQKISYMQSIVEKIFQRVKEHPEYADDLRKFMDYYLPTTVKLLDAYEELDSQPVQGDNIRNGKLEIEKTLDTLNVAFEKLLDSLFEDTAWDVSTDISVLQTMLAQEGLTEPGMKMDGPAGSQS